MKREDIEVRAAARAGDARACLAMAQRLFTGGNGLPRNVKLGLGYLQQEIAQRNPQALALVARSVPLEILAAHQLMPLLQGPHACNIAAAKLALWQVLGATTRTGALHALAVLHLQAFAAVDSPEAMAGAFATLPKEWLNASRVALEAAAQALRERRLADVAYALRVAAALDREAAGVAVWRTLQALGDADEALALPVSLIEHALRLQARQGEPEAQYALGRALAGLPHANRQPTQWVRETNRVRAHAWLMRAADGGCHAAWFDLYRIASARTGAADDEQAARFYLEKAARCGVPDAQCELGELLLAQARSLEQAEQAAQWLWAALQGGSERAGPLLQSLVLPLPPLAPALERQWLDGIAAADADLGVRAGLARSLGLTRHEALSLGAAHHLRAWGLVLPGCAKENPKGRVAPAATPAMQAALAQARSFYEPGSALAGSLTLHRGRLQRQVFRLLAIDERAFFAADIGRSWSHGGWGRHWAARRHRELPAAAAAAS